MGREFYITHNDAHPANRYHFVGYCDGVAYRAFDVKRWDKGVLSEKRGKVVTKAQAKRGVQYMLKEFRSSEENQKLFETYIILFSMYLDTVIQQCPDDQKFYIHFE